MKIASISCLKNEVDLIETFVRVNSIFIDIFVIIDDSKDGSKLILDQLINEGFSILILYRNSNEVFQQDAVVNSAIRFCSQQNLKIDYYLPLDIDEFPKFSSKSMAISILESIPHNNYGVYFWETYIPNCLNHFDHKFNGLVNCFNKRMHDEIRIEKVAIPARIANNIYINVGSHSIVPLTDTTPEKYILNCNLAHFPVRSGVQVLVKSIFAAYWLMRKDNRLPGEGYHVYENLNLLLSHQCKVGIEQLQNMAHQYANKTNVPIQLGPRPDWINDYSTKYPSNNQVNYLEAISMLLLKSWHAPLTNTQKNDFFNYCNSIFDNEMIDRHLW